MNKDFHDAAVVTLGSYAIAQVVSEFVKDDRISEELALQMQARADEVIAAFLGG